MESMNSSSDPRSQPARPPVGVDGDVSRHDESAASERRAPDGPTGLEGIDKDLAHNDEILESERRTSADPKTGLKGIDEDLAHNDEIDETLKTR